MQTTVIIPNHNYGLWIGDAIKSVLNQTYPVSKIIIVDDGSTDNSLDVISEIVGQSFDFNEYTGKAKIENELFRVHHWTKAKGPSFARNYGIGLASQDESIEAYAFLDSDDFYDKYFIAKTTAIMSSDTDYIGVVYTDSIIEDIPTEVNITKYWEPFSRELLTVGNRLAMNSLVNRKAIDKCGMFDPDLRTLEDWDLWLRISEHFVLVHIPEVLFTMRNHNNNSTASVSSERWKENHKKVLEKAYTRMRYA
jgi:glycosyltransferase involved in cell wall biosynthesis